MALQDTEPKPTAEPEGLASGLDRHPLLRVALLITLSVLLNAVAAAIRGDGGGGQPDRHFWPASDPRPVRAARAAAPVDRPPGRLRRPELDLRADVPGGRSPHPPARAADLPDGGRPRRPGVAPRAQRRR